VVGLGVSGMAALRLLERQGMELRGCDSRPEKDLAPRDLSWLEKRGIRVQFGGHGDEFFAGCDLVVLSPGVDQRQAVFQNLIRQGVTVIGELELASSLVSTPMVAITGTNGKSTVVKLVGEIFKASGIKHFLGGNYGTPLSAYLCDPVDCDWLVLEVSSFQLDTAANFKPEIGVILNITPDHLDRYEDFASYAASKFSLFANQKRDDFAILNSDDPEITARLDDLPGQGQRIFFGRDRDDGRPGAWVRKEGVLVRGLDPQRDEVMIPIDNHHLASGVNRYNCAAAVAVAMAAGCRNQAIRRAVSSFLPLSHRLTPVATIDGVLYLDDSKATNIGAVKAALDEMRTPVVLIAGGREKGADYDILAGPVKERVKAMLVIGEARETMTSMFRELTRVEPCEDMTAAVRRARELARPGDTVLLSPACASFDMFAGYSQRGEAFREAVLALDTEKEVC